MRWAVASRTSSQTASITITSNHQTSKPAKQGPTVLSVGAVKARKGMHVLIKAIAHVRDRVPDVQCVIVGSLKKLRYVQRIVSLIEELQLQNTVHLMEHLPR